MQEPDSSSLRNEIEQLRQRLGKQQTEILELEKQSALPQVIGGLAHELNNPLTAILGHAQRLQRSGADPAELKRRSQVLVDEVQRCIELVERLRGYASPLRGSRQPCKLDAALGEAVETLRLRDIHPPELAIDGPLIPVQAAMRPLAQALTQILDNARLAGAEHIWVSTVQEGEQVRMLLDNDGATPSQDEIDNGLRPFYSTRTQEGSSGLGLSVAAALLRQMGGSLHLDTGRVGGGARVSILLGAATPSANKLIGADDAVLVVDDEPLIAELLQDALHEHGWQSHCCASSQAALELADHVALRAALIDRRLADGDGLALLRELCARHPKLHGRVAIVTGDRDDPDVLAIAEEFDCPLLGKPFHLQQIGEVLRKILG